MFIMVMLLLCICVEKLLVCQLLGSLSYRWKVFVFEVQLCLGRMWVMIFCCVIDFLWMLVSVRLVMLLWIQCVVRVEVSGEVIIVVVCRVVVRCVVVVVLGVIMQVMCRFVFMFLVRLVIQQVSLLLMLVMVGGVVWGRNLQVLFLMMVILQWCVMFISVWWCDSEVVQVVGLSRVGLQYSVLGVYCVQVLVKVMVLMFLLFIGKLISLMLRWLVSVCRLGQVMFL